MVGFTHVNNTEKQCHTISQNEARHSLKSVFCMHVCMCGRITVYPMSQPRACLCACVNVWVHERCVHALHARWCEDPGSHTRPTRTGLSVHMCLCCMLYLQSANRSHKEAAVELNRRLSAAGRR